ncbi:MAG: CRISPR-associated protein Cas4 [Actinomycetota bacterium]|nr:CRISPR-associated protein Cas4 [Actinomycetota bacterium]
MKSVTSPGQSVSLTVTDIKQYIYCPRVVYFTYVIPLIRPTTGKMDYGKGEHERVSELEKRRKLSIYGLENGEREFHLRLNSERLGLSGLLDMAISTDCEIIPVEFKFSTKPPSLNHKYQLTAYTMLLEDRDYLQRAANGKRRTRLVRRGFVHLIPLKRSYEIQITQSMRDFVKKLLMEIRSMIENETMPSRLKENLRLNFPKF